MPIVFDPQNRFEVSLPGDKDRKRERPVFVFRNMTAREWITAQEFIQAKERPALAIVLDKLMAFITPTLVDWRFVTGPDGQPAQFNPSELPNLVTVSDMWDLLVSAINGSRMDDDAKKESGSPSPTVGEPSAAGVPAAAPASVQAPVSPQ